jgi:hypothetical protein
MILVLGVVALVAVFAALAVVLGMAARQAREEPPPRATPATTSPR